METIRHTEACSYYQNGNWCDCGARKSVKNLTPKIDDALEELIRFLVLEGDKQFIKFSIIRKLREYGVVLAEDASV